MNKRAPLPENEQERLAVLREFGILDTPVEPEFDRLTALAARVCDAPFALVSLVDAERQWFKSAYGLTIRETPRDDAFCAHTILTDETLVVTDAREDERFRASRLVAGHLGLRSYAGAPIIASSGHRLGALCVMTQDVTSFSNEQISALELLAAQAACQIEARHQIVEAESARMMLEAKAADLMFARDTLQRQADQLIQIVEERDGLNRRNEQYRRFIETLFTTLPIPIFARDMNGVVTHANPAYASLFNSKDGIVGKNLRDILPAYYAEAALARDREMVENNERTRTYERRLDYGDGRQARDIVTNQSLLMSSDGTVEGVVGGIVDVTEERALRDHLESLAATDPLTGAFNRRAFAEQALNEIERCRRQQLALAVISFDLDRFKAVNDTHGHLAGDTVLKAVTSLIKESLRRPTDFLGRLGGEEFSILAVQCELDDAKRLAERLRGQLEDTRVPWGQGHLNVTASFGVAELSGQGQAGLDSALRHADQALYAAKRNGRNCVYMWNRSEDRPEQAAA